MSASDTKHEILRRQYSDLEHRHLRLIHDKSVGYSDEVPAAERAMQAHTIQSLHADIARLRAELSAAQARIAELETQIEAHAWKVSPAMAQAQIDRLNDANDRLALQVTELERDKARLDWLDRNPMTYERGCGRAAIDQAMTPPPNNLPHA